MILYYPGNNNITSVAQAFVEVTRVTFVSLSVSIRSEQNNCCSLYQNNRTHSLYGTRCDIIMNSYKYYARVLLVKKKKNNHWLPEGKIRLYNNM